MTPAEKPNAEARNAAPGGTLEHHYKAAQSGSKPGQQRDTKRKQNCAGGCINAHAKNLAKQKPRAHDKPPGTQNAPALTGASRWALRGSNPRPAD